MTVTLIFLAVLMAFFVGWLFSRTIGVRPWVAGGVSLDDSDRLPRFLTTPRVGLLVFLAVITSLFALTISAYGMRMHMQTEWMQDWISVPVPRLVWFNTAMLVLASVAVQWAWDVSARGYSQGQVLALKRALVACAACTLVFIAGQVVAWIQLHDRGYSLAANPANSFFYFITALHAAHLLGGLSVWSRLAARVWRGAQPSEIRSSMELCAWYWHYLLIIWATLLGLLLST